MSRFFFVGLAMLLVGGVPLPNADAADANTAAWGKLIVPANHVLNAEQGRMNSPRVLQIQDSDFAIEVTVEGNLWKTEPSETKGRVYVSAGLVLMLDDKNYLRLERAMYTNNSPRNHSLKFERRDNSSMTRRGKSTDQWCWLGSRQSTTATCRSEVPNIVKEFEAHHDEGFEVLGICLDSKREAAEKCVEAQELAWPSLFVDDAGRKHPMAVRHAIHSIPTAVLIDRDGRIVSWNARGESLGKLLNRLLEAN